MEQKLGRPLVKGEYVHHKNGVRSDNRPENLELWASPSKKDPPGQRVDDMLEFLKKNHPERLTELISELSKETK